MSGLCSTFPIQSACRLQVKQHGLAAQPHAECAAQATTASQTSHSGPGGIQAPLPPPHQLDARVATAWASSKPKHSALQRSLVPQVLLRDAEIVWNGTLSEWHGL